MVADIREQGTAMVLFSTQHGPAHNRSAHVARISKDEHAFYAVVETGSTSHPSANMVIITNSFQYPYLSRVAGGCFAHISWERWGIKYNSNHCKQCSILFYEGCSAIERQRICNPHSIFSVMNDHQGCEWNDKSVNRERESRTRIGSDASFFWDSLSNLVIDDNFRISKNLGLDLAANISAALAIQPVRDREIEIILWFF